MSGTSLEERIKRLEQAFAVNAAEYRLHFADGSVRVCDPIAAMIARLDAMAGAGAEIVRVELHRGTEKGLGKFVSIIRGEEID